ncbi:hypothetical protein L596_013526 [Steinernema carpocapsae]|uniref:Uncharacterized protein n=1 Tax=Steinernema carpocapsae TaxID=34508 RepID=A0A4U5P133_STECR|nr:hypothetical protein L596_013526 [Steinernema carpocapsae]
MPNSPGLSRSPPRKLKRKFDKMYENAVSGFNDEVKSDLQETQKWRETSTDVQLPSTGPAAQLPRKPRAVRWEEASQPGKRGLIARRVQEQEPRRPMQEVYSPLRRASSRDEVLGANRCKPSRFGQPHFPYSETTLDSSAFDSVFRRCTMYGGLMHGEHGQTQFINDRIFHVMTKAFICQFPNEPLRTFFDFVRREFPNKDGNGKLEERFAELEKRFGETSETHGSGRSLVQDMSLEKMRCWSWVRSRRLRATSAFSSRVTSMDPIIVSLKMG